MTDQSLVQEQSARHVAVCLAMCLLSFMGPLASVDAQTCIATTPIGTGDDFGTAVSIQPDGRIVVGGYFFRPAPEREDMAALRYNADLRLDATFDSDGIATMDIWGDDHARDVVIQPDGKIVLGGVSNHGGEMGCCDQYSVTRFNSNGTFDAGFGAANGHVTTSIGGSWDLGYAMAVQPDGQIVVAGVVDDGSGNWDVGLIRYNAADGTLDPTFNPGGVYGIAPP